MARRVSLRAFVVRRAQGRCEYCRSPAAFAHQSFSLEHIRPRSRKGARALANLALSCQGCHNHKYNRTQARDPVTGDRVPLTDAGWACHRRSTAVEPRAAGEPAPSSGASRPTSSIAVGCQAPAIELRLARRWSRSTAELPELSHAPQQLRLMTVARGAAMTGRGAAGRAFPTRSVETRRSRHAVTCLAVEPSTGRRC
jgi:HNH endonuclease